MPDRAGTRRVAYMEEADDSGNAIPDTETYAASSPPSPKKEKPNTSRARKEKTRRDDSGSAAAGHTDSDSTVHPRSAAGRDSRTKSKEKEKEKEREKAKALAKKTVTISRPPTKHSKTTPMERKRSEDASYYGVNPTVTAATSRPRAQTATPRPVSYYGSSSRPPLANARWYDQLYGQPPAPSPSPGPLLPTSYPPNNTILPRTHPFASQTPIISQAPADYFSARPQLAHRFSLNRPASAMAHRTAPPIAYDYDIEDDRPLGRRTSLRAAREQREREQEDRLRMPPPPRPKSARPSALAYRPPPPPITRRFDDEAFAGDSRLYHDVSPISSYEYITPAPAPRSRRQSIGPTARPDLTHYRTEVAASGGNRRNSYYGQSLSSGSGYEDKMRQATAYQEDVSGGPAVPLTAETLRKVSKNGGPSSRSTRSSASKDESDYKHSATTRTTRSSANNDEDVTIRVKGNTVLKVGGAEMQCEDGAEINIISRGGGAAAALRGGSDRSSYVDADERRSRMVDRTGAASRTRASSQAASYSRTVPAASPYDPFAYRGPPPYPTYPSYNMRSDGFI